jgi:hypothetical protein
LKKLDRLIKESEGQLASFDVLIKHASIVYKYNSHTKCNRIAHAKQRRTMLQRNSSTRVRRTVER